MEYDTKLAAEFSSAKLDKLVNRVHRDTLALIEQDDPNALVRHFDAVRTEYDSLEDKVKKLKAEIDDLSRDIIPTSFKKHGIDKTTNIVGVGRVTVSVRWSASVNKDVGMAGAMDWCRKTGNEGLIIETINSGTLTGFAKESALEGNPLPSDIFNVSQYNVTSITKG